MIDEIYISNGDGNYNQYQKNKRFKMSGDVGDINGFISVRYIRFSQSFKSKLQ